jgi:hypothetical protein
VRPYKFVLIKPIIGPLTMVRYENIWLDMVIYGYVWLYMVIYGYPP